MSRALHIVPRWDVVAHEVDQDGGCVCGPTDRTEAYFRAMMWEHHSLDGRERRERSMLWRSWRKLTRRPLGWVVVKMSEYPDDPWLDE